VTEKRNFDEVDEVDEVMRKESKKKGARTEAQRRGRRGFTKE
jgi:hypothetical protein